MNRANGVTNQLRGIQRVGSARTRRRSAAVALAGMALIALVSTGQLLGIMVVWPVEWLVCSSDIIVVGPLRRVTDWAYYRTGTVEVKEVIWGVRVPKRLEVREATSDIIQRRFFGRRVPDAPERVWFLTKDGPGKFRVGHADRHYTASEVIRALEESPVFARRVGVGHNPPIELVFRNFAKESVAIPRFAVGGGRLALSSGVRVSLSKILEDGTEVEVRHLPSAIKRDEGKTAITVPGRSEYKVTFKPSRIYALEDGTYYKLTFEIEGYPSNNKFNWAGFYQPAKKKAKAQPAPVRQSSGGV
ncbi:MAG: hypothetical protein Q8Q12_17475 [bacterium]|nr:hypothetical protein [bacterium]